MLMRVAEEFGFRIRTLQHVLEGYKVAREIAAHGAGASTFSDWWAYKMEAYDAIPYNAAIMTRKGVLVSLNSDDEELMRRLNTEAAKAMKYGGVSETEALAMITINPAKQLGIDKRVGSIEPGKDADITIFDRHPLSNYAKVQKVLIDGRTYFDRDKDMSDRPAREERKKVLLDKYKPQERRRPQ
jgi:imidazolonepropionase-like amidohydrolase